MKKSIYLVDVSSLFFRAFYAIRPLTSSQGVPVNAVYGFISMIIKLMKEKSPEYILFCYDRKEPSFRKDIYSDYKANRTVMPDDLQVQMPYLKNVASLLGISDLEIPGYEADDIIGTVAVKAASEGFQVYIVSGDKDFSQLINENIFLYDTMKEFVFNTSAIKEKHGVYPDQFIDFLAITGDTSDHIPGVAGVGPKGAQKLIEQFGTLEKIYANIDQVKPDGLKQKLLSSRDKAFVSKKLVTIVTDIALEQYSKFKSIEDFKISTFKTNELRAFLQDLNFKSFEKSLLGDNQEGFVKQIDSDATQKVIHQKEIQQKEIQKSYQQLEANHIALTLQDWDFEKVQSEIKTEDFLIFNIENKIIFIFQNLEFYVYAIENNLVFNLSHVKWSGFDLKNVWHKLKVKNHEAASAEVHFDLMLASYCLKAKDQSDLFDVIEHHLNINLKPEAKAEVDVQKLAEAVFALNQKLQIELKIKNLELIYHKLEKPIIKILYLMEIQGIKPDTAGLTEFSEELLHDIKKLELEIHKLAGESFNIASPKQLGTVLFEKMGLEAIKKTKTGYSTDNEVLEKLKHPIAQYLIEYRELTKLKSTYVDALPQAVDKNNRLHTHFNQALTATGRLPSTDPNLQNIPIKTEKGQRVRKAFIADSNCQLLSLDYSQIELRVLAHISEDEGLINAFKQDLDIHLATAAEVFSIELKKVTSEQRRIAKAVNFGIAYGQGAYGLAETLGISRTESKEIIDRYFKKFSGIEAYIEKTIREAHENKYVETLFGRRRYITELDSTNAMIKKFGERAAINAPIQGTASDLMKMAMIDVQRYLVNQNSKLNLLLQVHDELIFEGTLEDLETEAFNIKNIMENVARFKVPLKVNSAMGLNWDEAH